MTDARLVSLARGLLGCPAAPFREALPAAHVEAWADTLDPRSGMLRRWRDAYGNLMVRFRRGAAARPVAWAAHLDHPGFHLAGPVRRGLVAARFLGGVGPEWFRRGTPVRLFSPDGKVSCRAAIDRLEDPRRLLLRLRLEPGAGNTVTRAWFGLWDLPAFQRRGKMLHGRACDDLMGVAAAMAALEEVVRSRRAADITLALTRAEEVGFAGALAIAQDRLLPRRTTVVSIENSRALADTPVGGGAVIRVGDRASVFDPGVTAELAGVAASLSKRDPSLRYQRRLMFGGTCEATPYSVRGYRTGAVCLPLGHYHNMVEGCRIAAEHVHLDDLRALVRLLAGHAVAVPSAGAALARRLDRLARKHLPALRRSR